MPDNNIPDDEKKIFRAAMHGVKPLHVNQPREPRNKVLTTQIIKRQSEHPKITSRPVPEYYLSDTYSESITSQSVLSYASTNIPTKRFQQLKKGQIPYQGRLDLHGLKVSDARETLIRFIEQHIKLAHRCLLIIHGKGGYQNEDPVIKNHVNHWLKQFPSVLAFHSALAKDGGTGSVYVLLQRKKIYHTQ